MLGSQSSVKQSHFATTFSFDPDCLHWWQRFVVFELRRSYFLCFIIISVVAAGADRGEFYFAELPASC